MPSPVRETQAMLAGMKPVLSEGAYVFCNVEPRLAKALFEGATGFFAEAEGTTLVLHLARAEALGFDTRMPMRRIVLEIYSALDGVGLTAAVATALANEDIPCNVIAAFHHDHIFVPENMAEEALAVLRAVQKLAQAKTDSAK
ncbi:ACT domain-containing protein [uncultured Nitratireductor sp.]|uniref:ACT domain-containing protein n=1 Tax=uncultured Nitratireductor sp. TaxID=520953 RepID=UPI0025D5D33B|nr:ACT domain-containing protein [uncultured Nitratireductor sp.]